MDKILLTVLNMSITSAFVIAAVILARLPLKKAPKIISYCLWAVVGFRLICPITIESVVSLIPFENNPIPVESTWVNRPYTYAEFWDAFYTESKIPESLVKYPDDVPLTTYIVEYGGYVWLTGAAAMLLYGIVSYLRLKRRMRTTIRVEGNIYETDNIPSPFVLGIIKPKIYLPLSLADGEREYILLHERTHIRRGDHIVKFAAYFILCLHWFNPLAWAAFLLMGVDMEMSCDERVLKELGDRRPAVSDTKHDYARLLLSFNNRSAPRVTLGPAARWPLAFGEGGVKGRIKNVLNFRKPSRVIVTLAVVLVAVLSVGFAVNRANKTDPPAEPPLITVKAGGTDIEWVVGKNKWNGAVFDRLDNFQRLMDDKTIDDLLYVPNGETITIWFEDKNGFPLSPVLTEFVLMENGNKKYNVNGTLYERFTETNRNQLMEENYSTSMSFEVKPNFATALSSNSADYLPGNTIKGYRFVCTWEGSECEYAFVVRGDAAMTMELEQEERPVEQSDPPPSDPGYFTDPVELSKVALVLPTAPFFRDFG